MTPAPENNLATRLHSHVRAALEQAGLVGGKTLVVAVSGGPDSLALLHALHHLRDDLGLRLHGAHLDHMLRGEASEADARFAADTFRRLGIPFTVEAADVATLRKERRLSLEDAARRARYAFLSRVAGQHHADAIALGHTADDQAETVLMHIIRGSGLTGLRGMGPVSRRTIEGRDVVLVRPLLEVSRQETLAYCRALGLEARQDESNFSPEFTRNRVRLKLMPVLERFNPTVKDALIRLSRSASRDLDFIDEQASKEWPRIARREDSALVLDRGALLEMSPALRDHILRRAVRDVKGDLDGIQQTHIDDMARLTSGPAGRTLDLPGGVRFLVDYQSVILTRDDELPSHLPPLEGEHRLSIPGETLIPGWRVTAQVVGPERSCSPAHVQGKERAGRSFSAELDFEAVGVELLVRTRRDGDRFQPLGMKGTKKLQDFMVDSKVPRHWRDRVPLLVSPRGIAWVVGWRIAEWARPTSDESRRLRLRFEIRR